MVRRSKSLSAPQRNKTSRKVKKLNLMRSLSATHKTKCREKFKMKIKLKFNAFTFRDAHNGTSPKETYRDAEKQDVAKGQKIKFNAFTFRDAQSQTSRKVYKMKN